MYNNKTDGNNVIIFLTEESTLGWYYLFKFQ